MREEVKIAVPFDVKQVSDEGSITGYGAVFNNIDYGFDKIAPGAFKASIRGKKSIPMLWQHFSNEPIGVWNQLMEDENGLLVKGEINLDVQKGREARSLAKQGAVTGLSIGFFPEDFSYEDDVRILHKVDVVEVSMATFPMNPLAQVMDAKELCTIKGFEQAMRERLGLSRKAAEAIRLHGIEGLKKSYQPRQSGNGIDADVRQADVSALKDSLDRFRKAIEG